MGFIRKVRTKSGATAVQVVYKRHGQVVAVDHVGSAHTEFEVGLLYEQARQVLDGGQQAFDLGVEPEIDVSMLPAPAAEESLLDGPSLSSVPPESAGPAPVMAGNSRVMRTASAVLWDLLVTAYSRLGFDVLGDEVFRDMALARIVEPTSKRQVPRVLKTLGVEPMHRATIHRHLQLVQEQDYRGQIAQKCFEHSVNEGDISLVLYDISTLFTHADDEDDFRKVGYSKERRVDPQILIGLLVDRTGFPLEVGAFEGNKAETHTILPMITQFQDRHQIADMVVVADAGMLSSSNLKQLHAAGLRFIVGSRQTKAPYDLKDNTVWVNNSWADGQMVDTITPRHGRTKTTTTHSSKPWDEESHPGHWRAVWQYRAKRAHRDTTSLADQEQRARDAIENNTPGRSPRFVKTTGGTKTLNEASLNRAKKLIGLKGYVTNVPASLVPAAEVISSYHDLWRVEESFRITKTDLQARPFFHYKREAIEAHLTIVFTSLAVTRHLQHTTGHSIEAIIDTLKPVQSSLVTNGTHTHWLPPIIPEPAQKILDAYHQNSGH